MTWLLSVWGPGAELNLAVALSFAGLEGLPL